MRVTPFVFAGLVAARAVIPRGADVQRKEIGSSHSLSTSIATPSTTVVGKPVSQPEQTTAAVLVKGGPATGNGTVPGGGIHPAVADTTSTPIAIGTTMPKPQQPSIGAQNGTIPAPPGNPIESHGSPVQPTDPPRYQTLQGSPSESAKSPGQPTSTSIPSTGGPLHPGVSSPHGSPASMNGTVATPGSAQLSGAAGTPKAGQSCQVDGALVCNGPDLFALCNFGKIDSWLHVAAGTACRDGKIGFA